MMTYNNYNLQSW